MTESATPPDVSAVTITSLSTLAVEAFRDSSASEDRRSALVDALAAATGVSRRCVFASVSCHAVDEPDVELAVRGIARAVATERGALAAAV